MVFIAKDAREVILRTPSWRDLDDLLGLIKSLVDEGTVVTQAEKVTENEAME